MSADRDLLRCERVLRLTPAQAFARFGTRFSRDVRVVERYRVAQTPEEKKKAIAVLFANGTNRPMISAGQSVKLWPVEPAPARRFVADQTMVVCRNEMGNRVEADAHLAASARTETA